MVAYSLVNLEDLKTSYEYFRQKLEKLDHGTCRIDRDTIKKNGAFRWITLEP